MAASINVTIEIGPARAEAAHADDPTQQTYLVKLREGATSIWAEKVPLSRQNLLLHANNFDVSGYGMELHAALFKGDLETHYQRLVGRAGSATTVRVQLEISTETPELHELPWERLFHRFGAGEPAPLATAAQTPFSRFLPVGAGDEPPVREPRLRMLVAIANPDKLPQGLSSIDVAAEVEALAGLVKGLQGRVAPTLLAGRTALPPQLRRRLETEGWELVDGPAGWGAIRRNLHGKHVLHILAHGQLVRESAYLLLEHEGERQPGHEVLPGALDRVAANEIIAGLRGVQPRPRLIFLAACESARRPEGNTGLFVGLAPQLAEAGVPAIVAMQDLVPMELAHTLTLDFYRRLFEHGEVDRALNEARNLLFKQDKFEWGIPVLFLRLADGRLFAPNVAAAHKPFEPELVFVPAGAFQMGDDAVPAEAPRHSATLGAFFIGRYPVTNREYAEFLRRTPGQDVPFKAGWFNRKPPQARLDHPVTGVSWYDAVAFCAWLAQETGRRYRLPSEAEWEKAARGVDGRRFPWGDAWDEGRANVGGTGTAPVMGRPEGESPYECREMAGNVEEWTRSLWGEQWSPPAYSYPYDAADGREPASAAELSPQAKVVHRGGSYRSQAGEARCALRDCADPASKIPWRGFRVVMEV